MLTKISTKKQHFVVNLFKYASVMIAIICPPRNIIVNKQTVYYDVQLTITTVKTGTMY